MNQNSFSRNAQSGIEINGRMDARYDAILTPEAVRFVTRLHDAFAGRRQERLAARMQNRQHIENGRDLRFLPETSIIRDEPTWRVAGAGPGLEDRRVEITSPADHESAAGALGSGAQVWLADLEDATSPTWSNIIGAQLSLFDAIRSEAAANGPTVVMRPRGWHLVEKHLMYRNSAGISSPASGSLVDFGLYFFHNAKQLISSGRGPYFYLPKIENHLEARLWDDVFTFSENALGIEHGTIRATVLIETISAAFEMEEILYELREHCAGLNAGRWDYIFSIIKNFRGRGAHFTLPDRSAITMTVPFMRAYTELLVSTAHKRGAYAIGGLSNIVPESANPFMTTAALEDVRADKKREAQHGFDGTWVAHPALVVTAQAEFDAVLGSKPNQLDVLREDVSIAPSDLIDLRIDGTVTNKGVRANVAITLGYIESWLRGVGAVAIGNRIEDASTAELSRAQLWQWISRGVVTVEGDTVTREWVSELLEAQLTALSTTDGRFADAAAVFREITLEESFPTFLTIAAYSKYLVETPELAVA